MIKNKNRVGRFTSSEIYKLLGTPKGRTTYIESKIHERRIGKSIGKAVYKKEMAWGKFMEIVVFDLLGLKYRITSKETTLHPKLGDIWSGSVDLLAPREKIGEIKAYQYDKHCRYADCLRKKDVKLLKKLFPQEYWQLVSNSIIHRVKVAEAIAYMPYESEIPEIKKMVDQYEGEDLFDYKWILDADDEDLPSLPDKGYYDNVTTFEFVVPVEDIILLTEAVIKAGEELKIAK